MDAKMYSKMPTEFFFRLWMANYQKNRLNGIEVILFEYLLCISGFRRKVFIIIIKHPWKYLVVRMLLWRCADWSKVMSCTSWVGRSRPRGYKTRVHSQTQNKAQWLAACGHVSASSQSLRTRVRKQPIIALYFESETVLKFYNLEACSLNTVPICCHLYSWKRCRSTLTVCPAFFSLCVGALATVLWSLINST